MENDDFFEGYQPMKIIEKSEEDKIKEKEEIFNRIIEAGKRFYEKYPIKDGTNK